MKKILLILGHTRLNSFCWALADNYEKWVKEWCWIIKRINLIEEQFDTNLITWINDKNIDDDVSSFQEDILRADHLVFVYPTRWYNMPAILKGFLDRTLLSWFAYKFNKTLLPQKLLKWRTAHIIVTADWPSIYYYLFGNPAIKVMKMTLWMCGIRVTRITKIFWLRKLSKEKKQGRLTKLMKYWKKLI